MDDVYSRIRGTSMEEQAIFLTDHSARTDRASERSPKLLERSACAEMCNINSDDSYSKNTQ
jgi:hypothetical protein